MYLMQEKNHQQMFQIQVRESMEVLYGKIIADSAKVEHHTLINIDTMWTIIPPDMAVMSSYLNTVT